jgi:hypothetical protein
LGAAVQVETGDGMGQVRKPYEKPAAIKLTAEQAKRKLLRLINRRDERVKKLLEMMFPENGAKRLQG